MRAGWIIGVLLACSAGASSALAENHLAHQDSAYLAAASRQPVDWYPYGPEAFKRARELNRPILLDVGAVWCAWCARMDKESYTRPEVAAFINQHFVAVKVDFDSAGELAGAIERAQAYLNLSAGLPLISFLTADGRLFDGYGYLPPTASGSKPSFWQALESALIHAGDTSYIRKNSYPIANSRRRQ